MNGVYQRKLKKSLRKKHDGFVKTPEAPFELSPKKNGHLKVAVVTFSILDIKRSFHSACRRVGIPETQLYNYCTKKGLQDDDHFLQTLEFVWWVV